MKKPANRNRRTSTRRIATRLLTSLKEALQSAALLGVDTGGVWDGARAAIAEAERLDIAKPRTAR